MRRAHFPLVHRRARAAFSGRSVATAAVLARELAIGLVFRVLALELLEARKRLGFALGLLGVLLFKGIIPGKTAVRISVSGLRGICAPADGPPVGSGAPRIARARADVAGAVTRMAGARVAGSLARVARADVANVVFGIAQALRCASGIVGVPTRTGSRICPRVLAGGIPRSGRARIARCVSRGIE